MQYFQKLAEGVQTLRLVHALTRHPEWWDADKTRTALLNSPHAQAHDILLRCCPTEGREITDAFGDLESVNRSGMWELPEAWDMALDLMRLVKGSRLGRVMITKLAPGGKITPHPDQGPYAEYYDRYHVVLQGLAGSLFVCGDESVQMQTGEIWWFNHRVEHSVSNNSKDDRIHLIVDIRIDP